LFSLFFVFKGQREDGGDLSCDATAQLLESYAYGLLVDFMKQLAVTWMYCNEAQIARVVRHTMRLLTAEANNQMAAVARFTEADGVDSPEPAIPPSINHSEAMAASPEWLMLRRVDPTWRWLRMWLVPTLGQEVVLSSIAESGVLEALLRCLAAAWGDGDVARWAASSSVTLTAGAATEVDAGLDGCFPAAVMRLLPAVSVVGVALSSTRGRAVTLEAFAPWHPTEGQPLRASVSSPPLAVLSTDPSQLSRLKTSPACCTRPPLVLNAAYDATLASLLAAALPALAALRSLVIPAVLPSSALTPPLLVPPPRPSSWPHARNAITACLLLSSACTAVGTALQALPPTLTGEDAEPALMAAADSLASSGNVSHLDAAKPPARFFEVLTALCQGLAAIGAYAITSLSSHAPSATAADSAPVPTSAVPLPAASAHGLFCQAEPFVWGVASASLSRLLLLMLTVPLARPTLVEALAPCVYAPHGEPPRDCPPTAGSLPEGSPLAAAIHDLLALHWGVTDALTPASSETDSASPVLPAPPLTFASCIGALRDRLAALEARAAAPLAHPSTPSPSPSMSPALLASSPTPPPSSLPVPSPPARPACGLCSDEQMDLPAIETALVECIGTVGQPCWDAFASALCAIPGPPAVSSVPYAPIDGSAPSCPPPQLACWHPADLVCDLVASGLCADAPSSSISGSEILTYTCAPATPGCWAPGLFALISAPPGLAAIARQPAPTVACLRRHAGVLLATLLRVVTVAARPLRLTDPAAPPAAPLSDESLRAPTVAVPGPSSTHPLLRVFAPLAPALRAASLTPAALDALLPQPMRDSPYVSASATTVQNAAEAMAVAAACADEAGNARPGCGEAAAAPALMALDPLRQQFGCFVPSRYPCDPKPLTSHAPQPTASQLTEPMAEVEPSASVAYLATTLAASPERFAALLGRIHTAIVTFASSSSDALAVLCTSDRMVSRPTESTSAERMARHHAEASQAATAPARSGCPRGPAAAPLGGSGTLDPQGQLACCVADVLAHWWVRDVTALQQQPAQLGIAASGVSLGAASSMDPYNAECDDNTEKERNSGRDPGHGVRSDDEGTLALGEDEARWEEQWFDAGPDDAADGTADWWLPSGTLAAAPGAAALMCGHGQVGGP